MVQLQCIVVNFDSHISNVFGYCIICMCGVSGARDIFICGLQGQEKH